MGGKWNSIFWASNEWVVVDHAKHRRGPHSHAHHGEHVHVAQKFSHPRARGAERTTRVFAIRAAGGVATETDTHSVRKSRQKCQENAS